MGILVGFGAVMVGYEGGSVGLGTGLWVGAWLVYSFGLGRTLVQTPEAKERAAGSC